MIRWLRSLFRRPRVVIADRVVDGEAIRAAILDALSRQPTQPTYRR